MRNWRFSFWCWPSRWRFRQWLRPRAYIRISTPTAPYYPAPATRRTPISPTPTSRCATPPSFQREDRRLGPDAWDTDAQAASIEQAIAKQRRGIITRFWDATPLEAVKKATAAGIPVVVTETRIGETAATSAGRSPTSALTTTSAGATPPETGGVRRRERQAGVHGQLGRLHHRRQAARREGIPGREVSAGRSSPRWTTSRYLRRHRGRQSVITTTRPPRRSWASTPRRHRHRKAMEELNVPAGKYFVVVHDREPATLDYIAKGYISATLCNKTATESTCDPFDGGLEQRRPQEHPLSADNAAAASAPRPKTCSTPPSPSQGQRAVLHLRRDASITTSLYNK